MRFMTMHKNQPSTEAGEPPSLEVVHRMGEFIGGYARAGKLVDGAGLGASKTRTRLVFSDGHCTTKQGPYSGERELPAATWLIKVRTLEEALGWAQRYGKILGEGELELGKVTEPWDLGLMPAPKNPPLQMLLIEKASPETETGSRTAAKKSALSRLKTEMSKAGVLLRSYSLQPSSQSKRLLFVNNKLKVIDGPFAESKELIGGFAVMDLTDIQEAVDLSVPYAEILGGTLEVDIRPLMEEQDDG